jgi:hypothetical protein
MADQAQGSAAGNAFSMSEVSSTKYTICVIADALLKMSPPGVSAAVTKACRNTCSALKATCTALAGTLCLGVSQAFRALLQTNMKFLLGASSACKRALQLHSNFQQSACSCAFPARCTAHRQTGAKPICCAPLCHHSCLQFLQALPSPTASTPPAHGPCLGVAQSSTSSNSNQTLGLPGVGSITSSTIF